MQTITQLVAEKARISEEQAQTAIDTVMTFLEDTLPGPISAHLDQALSMDVSSMEPQIDTILEATG